MKTTDQPTPFLLRLFRRWCHPGYLEDIEGDLMERFHIRSETYGRQKAKRYLSFEILKLFRPELLRPIGGFNQLNHFGMFHNFFLIAYRNLLKNKVQLLINSLGLGIAFSCCICAYFFLAYNIEFDSIFSGEKMHNVYRLHTRVVDLKERNLERVQGPYHLGPTAAEEINGIQSQCRIGGEYPIISFGKNAFDEQLNLADANFFDFFELPLVKGSYKSFENREAIFLSEELSLKLFKDDDPLGKMVLVTFHGGKELSFIVEGVYQDIPINSTIEANGGIIRIEHYEDLYPDELIGEDGQKSWRSWREFATFFKLLPEKDAAETASLFEPYIEKRNNPTRLKIETVTSYVLEPFAKPAAYSQQLGSWVINLRLGVDDILINGLMAFFILLIACFNLTNTTLAMMSRRLKEIGVRKVIGASRGQIVLQFMIETVLTLLIALVVGLLIAQIIVPAYFEMWDWPLGWENTNLANLIIALAVLLLGTSILVGIYPALLNSRFNSLDLIKGKLRTGRNRFSSALVSLQFAISIITLIGGITAIQNANFQESVEFGYDKEKLLFKWVASDDDANVYKNAIVSNPKIESVAKSNGFIGGPGQPNMVKIGQEEYEARLLGVGDKYFETVGLDLIQGRGFQTGSKIGEPTEVIINKTFLKNSGLENPVGQKVITYGTEKRIIGVVEDHLDNLFRSGVPEPFVFSPSNQLRRTQMVVARVDESDIDEVRIEMEEIWKDVFPSKPSTVNAQEDLALGGIRFINKNLRNTFLFLTILAALMSISGIFSLATLSAKRRTKEIGIRRTLGASVDQVVNIVNLQFVLVLVSAGVIGGVSSYFLVDLMLDSVYVYHINVGVLTVIGCVLGVFGIGVLTTNLTIRKSAKLSPSMTLRDE